MLHAFKSSPLLLTFAVAGLKMTKMVQKWEFFYKCDVPCLPGMLQSDSM